MSLDFVNCNSNSSVGVAEHEKAKSVSSIGIFRQKFHSYFINKPQGVGWWPALLPVTNISPDWEVIDRVPGCILGQSSYKVLTMKVNSPKRPRVPVAAHWQQSGRVLRKCRMIRCQLHRYTTHRRQHRGEVHQRRKQ